MVGEADGREGERLSPLLLCSVRNGLIVMTFCLRGELDSVSLSLVVVFPEQLVMGF